MIVTGGNGFIGSNLLDGSPGLSYDIKTLLENDVRDYQRTIEVLRTDIVHLAAMAGIPASIINPRLSHDINSIGTFNVLEAARVNGGKVILASSAAAENGQTPYAAYKRAGELYAEAYNRTYGVEYTVLRFANVYGPMSMDKESVVAKMCKDALLREKIYINGDCYRDFIHVSDVCRAITKSLETDYNGILNIGSGMTIPVRTIAEIVSEQTGAKIIKCDPRQGDVPSSEMDISKTVDTLNWRPQVDLEEGIIKTLEWFRNEL